MSNEIIQQDNTGFMSTRTIDEALKVAELISNSSFCPVGLKGKAGDVLVCLQMGQELGLKPMQAIQNIAVINGRPSLWGDAMLAVCRQSPDFEYIKENHDEKTKTAFCIVKRRNEPEFIQSFSQEDAVTAGLWNKVGPWKLYPRRMLQMRARGLALRDSFPDLLRGIIMAEELQDTPAQKIDYSRMSHVIYDQDVNINRTINSSELLMIREKIELAGHKDSAVCKSLQIDKLEDMQVKDLDEVNRKLNRKIAEKKKTDLPINKMLQVETQEVEEKPVDPEIAEWMAELEG